MELEKNIARRKSKNAQLAWKTKDVRTHEQREGEEEGEGERASQCAVASHRKYTIVSISPFCDHLWPWLSLCVQERLKIESLRGA